MATSTHLQRITAHAKKLKKSHPQTKWTNLIKMASKELGAKKVSGNKAKSKTMTKGKTVVVAGHKKPAHRKHRRVSGIKTHMKIIDAVKMLAGNIIGGSVGAILYRKVPGKDVLKGSVQLAAGLGGMMVIPEKDKFFFGLATGIGTGGGVNLMHTTGVISGVEDMVSGLFDGMSGNEDVTGNYRDISEQTSGLHRGDERRGLHDGGYVGYTEGEIDKWVTEGIPGLGGDDWKG